MSSRLDPYSLAGARLRERYSIDSFVGVGRFSVVYRGTELATERPVALRLLKARGTLTSSERTVLVERLSALLEPVIELAEHAPAFADVLDVTALVTSEARWMPVVVHAWAPGRTLESLLAAERQRGEPPRSIARAVELLSPVADAIQYAHARGLVHGSLSPRSVFVRERERAIVGDFGLAQALATLQAEGRALGEQTAPMHTFATAYGAPEQFCPARGDFGPSTDVFALALLVVELVTRLPPLGDGDDEQLERASADPVYRPTSRNGGVSFGPYVQSVLERALAVKPEQRYASVASFWEALRAASRVMLRSSSSSITPPPLPGGPGYLMPVIPPSARVPPVVSMQSIARADLARPPAERARASSKPSIPPHEFFAPSEAQGVRKGAAVALDEIPNVTNPLFAGNARSVAPTAMDAPTASQRAADARSDARARLAFAAAAAFAVTAGGAALARRGASSRPVIGSTPLPADVLATVAAIPPPRSAPSPCPTGMVRVAGATVSLRDATAREVTVAPYCIDALEVTVDRFTSCTDASCKHAASAASSNAWTGISWFEHKTFDPLCNARDAKARGSHPINCVDWKTASAYCGSRGGRLPTDAEWELAASTAPVGSFPLGVPPHGPKDAVGNAWEWTSDSYLGGTGGTERTTRGGAPTGVHADRAKPPLRWQAAPSTRSYAIGFRCAAAAP